MTTDTTQPGNNVPPNPNAPLFREAQQEAIEAFWDWWQETGADVLDGMFSAMVNTNDMAGSDTPGSTAASAAPVETIDIQDEVGGRLAAIHPRLIWGFEPGAPLSKHLMTVTAAGDPELRPIARRWLNSAPDDDATWAFTDLRQADPAMPIDWDMGPVVDAEGRLVEKHDGSANMQTIDPADARVQCTPGNGFVDVRLYHPAFEELARKGESGQRSVIQLGFTMMQLALGEEDFGLWLRNFAFSEVDPPNSVALPDLHQEIAKVAEDCPGWLTIDAEANGEPVRVTTSAPLVQLVNPLFTEHVVIQLLYTGLDEKKLPDEQSHKAITEMNAKLIDALGEDGVVVATETSDGVYLLHAYVDSVSSAGSEAGLVDVETETPAQRLERIAQGWSEGQVDVEATYDPAWERVGHLRV
ncbi:DUF695 domain-containing protein [Corynebacterium sp. H78]|uniref:DUF695 domain-containing protein n=1 Tax=Corynebacterium sp. H78 TaxID=3133417 RepID=UPI0030B7D650